MFGFFVVEVGLSVVVGWAAQRWKGRTGAAWALIAFVAQMLTLAVLVYSVERHVPDGIDYPSMMLTIHLGTMAAGLVMLGVVATLPKR